MGKDSKQGRKRLRFQGGAAKTSREGKSRTTPKYAGATGEKKRGRKDN